MKIPEVSCKIEAYGAVNPSEDPEKVKLAISNVILDADYEYKDGSIKATSRDLHSLSRILETIQSRKVNRVYRRQMRSHTKGDTTWFYLNKQAAYVNVVAICDEAEESPMGPIKVILHSINLERIIDWLGPEFVR
jgi:uncharacterized protein